MVDGDTIEVRSERIRLHGIDAPESGQCGAGEGFRCGRTAALPLADRIGAQRIRCDLLDRDRYVRHIGRCFLADADVSRWMVREGQAVAYRRFSTEFVSAETAARREKVGLWQGDFDLPWDWRRGDRRILGGPFADTAATDAGCPIKGNISRSGERICASRRSSALPL